MTDGRPPALTRATERGRLQAAFLRFYDQDAEFGNALLALVPLAEAADITHGSPYWRTHVGLWNLASQSWDRHPPGRRPPRITEITAFVRAADELAGTFGLDRLGDVGRAYIFGWFDRLLRASAAGSAHPSADGPGRISVSPITVTFEPGVGGHIGPPWEREHWDPTREPRRDARLRLERIARDQIQAALDQVERETIELGLTFPDTAPNLRRDLGWLYRKVRHRESFQAILDSLESPPNDVETVRKAVIRMAGKVGVDHRGWETGWR